MSFGWSVGDIAQAVRALHNLIQALDSVNGAARDYRETIAFLNDLSNTLKPLQHSEVFEADEKLRYAIKQQVEAIKGPVEEFLRLVGKFEQSLGLETMKGSLRSIPRKLQWHYSTSSHAKVLRDKVDRHLRILDTLFQQLTTGLIYRLPSEIRGIFREVLDERLAAALEQSLRPLEANIMAQWSAIDRGPEALVAYLQDNNSLRPLAMDAMMEIIHKNCLGNRTTKLLMDNYKAPASVSTKICLPSTNDDLISLYSRKPENTSSISMHRSRHRIDDVRVSRQIISRLAHWWRCESSLLWIQEGFQHQANQPSEISTVIYALAEETDTAVFWHACEHKIDENGYDVSQKAIFLELLASLLEQTRAHCCNLMDYKVGGNDNGMMIPRSDLESGLEGSIQNCIGLLQLRLTQMRRMTMFVLDGLNYLDYSGDKEVEEGLENLLALLYPPAIQSSSSPIKTLLSTQGQTLFLLDRIPFQDKIDVVHIGKGDDDILLAGLRRETRIP